MVTPRQRQGGGVISLVHADKSIDVALCPSKAKARLLLTCQGRPLHELRNRAMLPKLAFKSNLIAPVVVRHFVRPAEACGSRVVDGNHA